MTCIVGLVSDEHIWIGGDRVASDASGRLTQLARPKIIMKTSEDDQNMIMGVAGQARAMDIVQYEFTPPAIGEKEPDAYMATKFGEVMKEAFKKNGILFSKDGMEYMYAGMMIGYMGKLWVISSDFYVSQCADPYEAMGSGVKYALGSLYSTYGLDPHDRVERSLKAAEWYSESVRSPFDFLMI